MTILEEPYEGDCSDDYSDDYNSPYRVANIFVKNVGHSFTGSDQKAIVLLGFLSGSSSW